MNFSCEIKLIYGDNLMETKILGFKVFPTFFKIFNVHSLSGLSLRAVTHSTCYG